MQVYCNLYNQLDGLGAEKCVPREVTTEEGSGKGWEQISFSCYHCC